MLTSSPSSDIEETLAGIMLHDEDASVTKIVRRQKFAFGVAAAPYDDLIRALHFGLMKSPDKRGRNMAVLRMIVVAGTIEICRHHGDKVGAKLSAISLRQLNPGNLGHRIPLVGRLKRAS